MKMLELMQHKVRPAGTRLAKSAAEPGEVIRAMADFAKQVVDSKVVLVGTSLTTDVHQET